MGQRVAAFIAVERWRETANVYALSDTSFMPTSFPREHFDVTGAEVVAGIGSMLHDGRFEHARGGLGCREMLSISGCS